MPGEERRSVMSGEVRRRLVNLPPGVRTIFDLPDGTVPIWLLDVIEAEVERFDALVLRLQSSTRSWPEVMNATQAAEFLTMSEAVLLRHVRAGRVPHGKVHGSRGVRFVRADLILWIRRGCPKPRARKGR